MDAKRKKIYKMFGGKCAYCGSNIDIDNFHIEHKFPKAKGGSNNLDNLFPSCCECNLCKGTLDIEGFRKKLINKSMGLKYENILGLYLDFEPLNKNMKFYFERFE